MGLLKDADPKAKLVGRVFIVFLLALMLNYLWVYMASRFYFVINAAIHGMEVNKDTILQMVNNPSFLFVMALYNVLIAVAVIWFWLRYDKKEIADLGITWDGKAVGMLFKGVFWALISVAAVIIAGLMTGAVKYTGTGFAEFGTSVVTGTVIFGFLTFAVIAFGEEVLYRGYMQRIFTAASDSGTAIFFASALYIFAHITVCHDTFDFINMFLFGAILGYAFLTTGSLYMSIGFHFIWRFVNTTLFNIQNLTDTKGVTLFVLQSGGDITFAKKTWGSKLDLITFLVELAVFAVLYLMARKQIGPKTKKKGKKK